MEASNGHASVLHDDQDDKTYRTKLLEFLTYEQGQLEQEKGRIDERLLEIHNHISAIVDDKSRVETELERVVGRSHSARRGHRR